MDSTSNLVIWGEGKHVSTVLGVLNGINLPPKKVVCASGQRYGEMASELPQDYLKAGTHSTDKIIGIATGADGRLDFPAAVSQVIETAPDVEIVHHPVAISDLGSLSFSGRAFLAGYPGSGNGLVQAIFRELKKIFGPSVHPALESQMLAFAGEHYRFLEDGVRWLGRALDRPEILWGTVHRTVMTVSLNGKEESRIAIYGIQSKSYLYGDIHASHEPFSPFVLFLIERGYKPFLILRNPLDIFVSVANKLASAYDLLGDMEVFSKLAISVKRFIEGYLEKVPQISVVRYESIFSDPRRMVKTIGAQMGFDHLDEEQIQSILEKVYLKPTSGFAGHLWKPGVGKYREYLARQHYDLLDALGYKRLMKDLDYNWMPENGIAQSKIDLALDNAPYQDTGHYGLLYDFPISYGKTYHIHNDRLLFHQGGRSKDELLVLNAVFNGHWMQSLCFGANLDPEPTWPSESRLGYHAPASDPKPHQRF